MATITEAYVSFETAKLLKEKGFDEECRSYYFGNGKDYTTSFTKLLQYDMDDDEILRPTQQMAMRWLMEVHNLYIVISPIIKNPIFTADNFRAQIIDDNLDCQYETDYIDSYEKAVEAAIKYCLEHLI